MDSRLRTPPDAAILSLDSPARTLFATIDGDSPAAAALEARGGEILCCREDDGRVDLADLLSRLGSRGVQSILLEGGRELAGAALRRGLIDKFLLFFAPKLLGGGDGYGLFAGVGPSRMAEARALRDLSVKRFGDDILIEGYPERSCLPD